MEDEEGGEGDERGGVGGWVGDLKGFVHMKQDHCCP